MIDYDFHSLEMVLKLSPRPVENDNVVANRFVKSSRTGWLIFRFPRQLNHMVSLENNNDQLSPRFPVTAGQVALESLTGKSCHVIHTN